MRQGQMGRGRARARAKGKANGTATAHEGHGRACGPRENVPGATTKDTSRESARLLGCERLESPHHLWLSQQRTSLVVAEGKLVGALRDTSARRALLATRLAPHVRLCAAHHTHAHTQYTHGA
eukprot:2410597-Prymnesium_polylepis.1